MALDRAIVDGSRLRREAAAIGWWERTRRLEAVYQVPQRRTQWLAFAMVPMIAALASIRLGVAPWVLLPALVIAALLVVMAIVLPQPSRFDEKSLARMPFPITGLVDWLVSFEPLLDVRFRAALEPRQLAAAVAAVSPRAVVTWLDDRTARIAIPPRPATTLRRGRGQIGLAVGDRDAFTALLGRILLPLHAELGIERVEMGGAAI